MQRNQLPQVRRRRNVARLRLRGLSTREIAEALKVSHATIVRDLKVVEADWRALAAGDLDTHKATLLAEHRELRREIWSSPGDRDYGALLRSLDLEARLLGLYGYTPTPVDIEKQIAELGLDPASVLRQVEEILAGDTE